MTSSIKPCKQCGNDGTGNYCNNCGQSLTTKRLTVSTIVHEIFHFFSHLDKGFLFTLKRLITSPGQMQLEYVTGHRAKYQKPFSMFFLCATLATFIFYGINLLLLKYFDGGDANEASILRQYNVILQVVLLPAYAMITYGVFIKYKYNYAEIFVLLLYSISLLLLISSAVQLLKFVWTDLETQYIELAVVASYNIITNLSFFKRKKSAIILNTIIASALCFIMAGLAQKYLVSYLS